MAKQCTVPNCVRTVKAKSLCGRHYQQEYRTGTAMRGYTALEWLEANGSPDSDACVDWPFSTKKNGYGQISVDGRNKSAHRVSCEIFNGPPPSPQHEAAHFCGNRRCVNRRHLRWATPTENAADRIVHGTHLEGEKAGPAKLTNAQARQILMDNGKQREIAARYGVTQKVVSLIKRGKTYRAALGMR